ncbi:hypothetical protein RCL1_008417 [Eukaryota sp. TZLM3-RCL]
MSKQRTSLTIRPSVSFPIRWKCHLNNTIYDVLSQRPNWEECCDGDENDASNCSFVWFDVHWIRTEFDSIPSSQAIFFNHFRNHYELTRKDLLIKNLKRVVKSLERSHPEEASRYLFFPPTYTLPAEYALFLESFRKHQGAWIMKPNGKAQGKGIFLITKPSQVLDWRRSLAKDQQDKNLYIVQKYIENPLLLGGRKFDLRLYLLVTSFNPLVAYTYREGFARLSASRFSMAASDISNNFVHLTNVAIQKQDVKVSATAVDNQYLGLKWSLRSLLLYLCSLDNQKALRCFMNIQDLMVRSVMSVSRTMISDPRCIELYGFDILIDSDLKPWLIEINASPSLSASDDDDYKLKYRLLEDMLNVLDLEGQFPANSERVGGFDRVLFGEEVSSVFYLGSCNDDRVDQLNSLKKKRVEMDSSAKSLDSTSSKSDTEPFKRNRSNSRLMKI